MLLIGRVERRIFQVGVVEIRSFQKEDQNNNRIKFGVLYKLVKTKR